MKSFSVSLLMAFLTLFSVSAQNIRHVFEQDEKIGDFGGMVYDLCFSASGKALYIPQGNEISIYDVSTRGLIKKMGKGHTKPILALDLSGDSTILASGGLDSLILIWDIQTAKKIESLNYNHGIVTTLSLNPRNNLLASGSTDKSVSVYDLKERKIVYILDNLGGEINAVKFSPDGLLLVVATQEKQVRLYNAVNGKLIAGLAGHKNGVRDLCFNKSGTQLFSCGDDSRLITWDLRNLNLIRIINTESYGSDWLLSVDVNKDTDAQVVAGLDTKITVINNYGKFRRKTGVSVNKVIFRPGMGDILHLAVATRGKGVFLIDTMKFDKRDF